MIGPQIPFDASPFVVDFADPSIWKGLETESQTLWRSSMSITNGFPANTTITENVEAPDGSMTAIRVVCKPSGSSLIRANFTYTEHSFTDETIVATFFARLVSGTAPYAIMDVNDRGPSKDYLSELVQGEWVLITAGYQGMDATGHSFIDMLSDVTANMVIEFWKPRFGVVPYENNRGIRMYSSSSDAYLKNTHMMTFKKNYIQVDRYSTGPSKMGGYFQTLKSPSVLYQNFTHEVWVNLQTKTPIGSLNENWCAIAAFTGYHYGFLINDSNLMYYHWNGGISIGMAVSATLVPLDTWKHLVMTRDGDAFTMYIDGVSVGSWTQSTANGDPGSTGYYCLGASIAGSYATGQGNFCHYSKAKFGRTGIYRRCFKSNEVKQLFNATRGRFGV